MPPQTIPWSKTVLLKWSDFEAESNPAAFADALSTIQYRATWTVNSEKMGEDILFFIEDIRLAAEFFPELSWVREMYATSELLRHEQGHFDLTELLRGEITAKITDTVCDKKHYARGKNEEQRKQFAREHSSSLITQELKKWQSYMEERRAEYDTRTDFGRNADVQSEYDDRFSILRR